MSRFGPSFNVFNNSQRHTGKKEKLKAHRILKNIILRADSHGINLDNVFHNCGFLFEDWVRFNSSNQYFSAFFHEQLGFVILKEWRGILISQRSLPTQAHQVIHPPKEHDWRSTCPFSGVADLGAPRHDPEIIYCPLLVTQIDELTGLEEKKKHILSDFNGQRTLLSLLKFSPKSSTVFTLSV